MFCGTRFLIRYVNFMFDRLAENESQVASFLKDDFNTAGVMNSVFDLISAMNVNMAKVYWVIFILLRYRPPTLYCYLKIVTVMQTATCTTDC